MRELPCQICQILEFTTILNLIYVISYKPYKDNRNNRVEISNDICALYINLILLLFLNPVLEGIWRDGFGYTCVIVAALNIGAHLVPTFYNFFVGCYYANKKRKANNKLETIKRDQEKELEAIKQNTSKEYEAMKNVIEYKE